MPVDKFPGFHNLFSLDDPLGNAFRAEFDSDNFFKITSGEIRPERPVVVAHFMGQKKPSDIIWTSHVIPIIVHARVMQILTDYRFFGWQTYNVDLRGHSGERIGDYYGLSITGRCGPIDYGKSEVFYQELPGGKFPRLRGSFFEEKSWDGSDFFMELPDSSGHKSGHKYVTKKVHDALKKAKIRNLNFTRLAEFETDPKVIAMAAPNRLPRELLNKLEAGPNWNRT